MDEDLWGEYTEWFQKEGIWQELVQHWRGKPYWPSRASKSLAMSAQSF